MVYRIEIGIDSEQMIDHDIMINIGHLGINEVIIREMTIVTLFIEEIVATVIIHQGMIEMIDAHTKVTDIIMIGGGMRIINMVIIDLMRADVMIDDPKDLDNST